MSGAPPEGIAIIGLYGRFPGAPDLPAFWRNLRDGVDSLTFFSDEQLLAAGLRPEEVGDPSRVRAGRPLEGIDEFDAAFFGYTPREAQLMDPQQRLFLEGAWSALEDAGYTAEHYHGLVAVYAGLGLNTYLLNHLAPARGTRLAVDDLVALLGSEKDFAATRVSFHLDLRGPSFAVQSGCSSSLVAVVQAYHALASHQCDMALAGGASISVPQDRGYVHVRDGILSPDGRCRPFDARGQGTSFGSGLGIVVLKRLEDALADGDGIRAVIRGAAVNNDGARKLGYTAPSVERQAEVIATAQALAQVDPRTISYVEAHGTATALGDPVEVAALTAAFGAEAAAERACALGSVKGNIGHLDAASGVAGLIKTVLALEHRQIPPSLHFERPNPTIDFEGSPFFVNSELCDWKVNGTPRRAGVSSFGIGGTNAHLVLEEAPPPSPSGPLPRPHQVLVLSARTPAALDAMAERLAAHLETHPELALADVAWTLQIGRRTFEHRRALVSLDLEAAARGLREPRPAPTAGEGIAFVFAGAEPPHPGAARELYELEPGFRRPFDDCCQRLERHLGLDLHGLLLSDPAGLSDLPRAAPAARFAVEHALAQLYKEWGLAPAVAVGRGPGALVAASLSGVLHLDDAALLAASSGEGPGAFAAALKRVPLRPLLLPLVSEVTGARLSPQEAMSPRYWMRWLEQPDRLERALELLRGERRTLLWIGTGGPERGETEVLARALADAWASGAAVDWTAYGRGRRARRVPLPTYPFERTRHWFTPDMPDMSGARPAPEGRSSDPERWFHLPSWSLAPPPADGPPVATARWLLVVDGAGYWDPLLRSLRERTHEVVLVRQGERFEELGPGSFALDLASREDCGALARALGGAPGETHMVHVWPAAPDVAGDEASASTGATGATSALAEVRRGLLALYLLADALGAGAMTVVSAGGVQVAGEPLRPAAAALLGAARVLSQDRTGLRVRCIDVEAAQGERAERQLVDRLLLELEHRDADASTGALVALRGRQRWVPRFEPVALADPGPGTLRERGVYLITGGLGGIGRTLAEFLAAEVRARLVLVGRSEPPLRNEWNERPELRWLTELEQRGAEVLLAAADVSDRDSMARAVARARQAFGGLDGVIHAAGVPGAGLRQGEGEPPSDAALAAKVAGTLVLAEVCGEEPDFIVLCSALAAVLGGLGQADYCAANAFMDAFATQRLGRAPRWVSIGWDTWSEVGMAVEADLPEELRARQRALLAEGLTRQEGVEVFRRALASPHPHVLVSTRPLASRLDELAVAARARGRADITAAPRADGAAPAAGGSSLEEIERTVAHLWTTLLGVGTATREDNFFVQGGNSLLATQMLGGILRRYPGSEISLRRFFEDPTLGGLARAVAAASAEPAGAAEPAGDDLRQRLRAAGPEERPVLLQSYVAREVAEALGVPAAELEGPGGLEVHDETLVAAHLTWALRRDLDLPLYPHEIRARHSVGELAQYVGLELARLAERGGDSPGLAPEQRLDMSDPYSVGRATRYVRPHSRGTHAARNPSMAFVLSAPRSGSTLLRVMLSGHPELFCPPELFLLDNDTMRSWERDPFSEFYRDGLVRAFMALRDVEFAAAQELVRGLVEADTPVQEVYRQLQAVERLLVDKTPTYGLSRATLERAEALFDRPRHVVLVRHPMAVIDSIVRNRLDRVRRAVGDPHALAERYWVQTYRNLAELRERVGTARAHLVRYEDLVRSPEAVLRDLCAFLGVGFSPAVLDPYRCGRMLGGPGDPNFFQRGAVDPELADAWRKAALPRPLGEACVELARGLGYELP